jgi:hypothetical protein
VLLPASGRSCGNSTCWLLLLLLVLAAAGVLVLGFPPGLSPEGSHAWLLLLGRRPQASCSCCTSACTRCSCAASASCSCGRRGAASLQARC